MRHLLLLILMLPILGQGAKNLTPADYCLKGICVDDTASALTKVFGQPLSIERQYNHYTDPDSDYVFTYVDVVVYLSHQNRVVSFKLTSAKSATSRSVRIGSLRSEVALAYGEPTKQDVTFAVYEEKGFARGVTFSFQRDTVASIYLGWFSD